MFGEYDRLINGPTSKLGGVSNVGAALGHLGFLYNDHGIKLLLDAVYNPGMVASHAVNPPDPLTNVIDYPLVKESQTMRKAS